MLKKFKKYLNFDYFLLIWDLIFKGQYIKTTYLDPEETRALITTNFYLDGDALNVIYENNDEIVIEEYPDKLREHIDTLKKKIASMEIFEEHIKILITIISAFISLFFDTGNFLLQLGLFGALGFAGRFLWKYIFRIAIWVIKFGFKLFAKRFGFG